VLNVIKYIAQLKELTAVGVGLITGTVGRGTCDCLASTTNLLRDSVSEDVGYVIVDEAVRVAE
jgi:hypothetical protein